MTLRLIELKTSFKTYFKTFASLLEAFLEHVWRLGGGLGTPRLLEVGDADGRGCERRVAGCIVERIQEATLFTLVLLM